MITVTDELVIDGEVLIKGVPKAFEELVELGREDDRDELTGRAWQLPNPA